jgi:membrane-associated phospholipid phosphatase
MKDRVNTSGPLEYWIFWPPLVLLLLIVAIYFGGLGTPLFLALNHLSERAGDFFWIGLTTLGDGLVVCVLLLPFVRRKPEMVWSMVLSWILVALYVKGIKNLISVPRPLPVLSAADFHLIGAPYRFNSFPSGHAAVAATSAATFCLFYKQRWLRALLVVGALLIGLSRVAMGLHWVTDVLVGFLGGWSLALLAYPIADKLRFGVSPVTQVIIGVMLSAAAVRMLFVNHTDYDQAFRLQQAIAFGSLVLTAGDICQWRLSASHSTSDSIRKLT